MCEGYARYNASKMIARRFRVLEVELADCNCFVSVKACEYEVKVKRF